MLRVALILLLLSLIGNIIGLYFIYKQYKSQKQLAAAHSSIASLTETLDGLFATRMIFIHHSVGDALLTYGGLADSLRGMGILVKGATYGDEIGNRTDMCDWLPKFQNDMNRILTFKAHPDIYYQDGKTNDIVMFKSCFPNSDIDAEGTAPGDPVARAQTTANYKALFESLKEQLKKYPDKLFIYMTAPPLVPEATKPENAKRAREFNNWLVQDFAPRYYRETGLNNFAVFDLFDALAGTDNYLKKEYRLGDGDNSHPNAIGDKAAAKIFMDFFHPLWSNWQLTGKKKAAGPAS